ncbi:MAG: hypothetical protein WA322_08695 [Pseudolabrys sp.]
MPDDTEYLNAIRTLWLEQKNPVWPWLAVKTSIQNKHPVPQWVSEYLEKTAEQLLSEEIHVGDFARKLPAILGFQATLLAHSGHFNLGRECPLLGVKRT